jgi:hypothetical protein
MIEVANRGGFNLEAHAHHCDYLTYREPNDIDRLSFA